MGTMTAILLGIMFAMLVRYAGINKFDTICGFATFTDFRAIKTVLAIMSIGAFSLTIIMSVGFIQFEIPPLSVNGIIWGGVLFGSGTAILGYTPATLPISAAEGSVDAMFGILGALLGGIVFSIVYPYIEPFLGPVYEEVSLYTSLGGWDSIYITIVTIICIILFGVAIILNRIDKRVNKINSHGWLYTGIGISILNILVLFSGWQKTGIGTSSAYPYISDRIAGNDHNEYFSAIAISGEWELKFLIGSIIYSLFYSLTTRQFEFKTLNANWLKYRGCNPITRIAWCIFGGFILIFGARMANGYTSDNLISGCMQFAFSSYLFLGISLACFLLTGTIFYRLTGRLTFINRIVRQRRKRKKKKQEKENYG